MPRFRSQMGPDLRRERAEVEIRAEFEGAWRSSRAQYYSRQSERLREGAETAIGPARNARMSAPTTVFQNPSTAWWMASSAEISTATQFRLLETEESLLNNQCAIARSSKLLGEGAGRTFKSGGPGFDPRRTHQANRCAGCKSGRGQGKTLLSSGVPSSVCSFSGRLFDHDRSRHSGRQS